MQYANVKMINILKNTTVLTIFVNIYGIING